jgi:hypothetical protein
MPRFFFHIRCWDQTLSRDELGLDFPDVESTCAQVFCAAMALRDEFAARDEDPRDYSVEITNAAGELVLSVPFSEIFDGQAWRQSVLHAEAVGRA